MERVIRVTGKGSISVKPDTIRLDIKITKVCKKYGDAVQASAEDTGLLRETIEKAGLKPKRLKTVKFIINSEYESYYDKNDNYKTKFIGFRYTHKLYIQFPNNNEQLGRVLYELAKCDVEVEFNIRHTVKDAEAVKNKLLAKAIEDSKIKAETLTNAAGVSLGKINTIDYSWGEMEIYAQPINTIASDKMPAKRAAPRSYDIDIEADDINVEDTVTVVWEIK